MMRCRRVSGELCDPLVEVWLCREERKEEKDDKEVNI